MATFIPTGPPQPVIPYSPDTKYIAKGSFGCVVKPGLPNKGPDTNWEQFPNNITKIFKRKKDYKTGLNSTIKAHQIMGKNTAHRMNEYKYKYTARNLPKKILNSCKLTTYNDIYASRLPNLGISFFDLNGNTEAIDKIHRISFITLLEQILKVLEQVDKLQKANYVHGDIRENNVMIDPKDGRISIIDFDWLLPKDNFFSDSSKGGFPLGFYNSPPESIVAKYLIDIQNITESTTLNRIEQYLPQIESFKDSVIYFLGSNVAKSRNITEDDLKDIIIENIEYYNSKLQLYTLDKYNKYIKVTNELFRTYDSYSIGYSLMYMMNILYPGRVSLTRIKQEEFIKMKDYIRGKLYDDLVEYNDSQLNLIAKTIISVKSTLQSICNIDAKKRTTIDIAIDILNEEIKILKNTSIFKAVANAEKDAVKELKEIPIPPPAPTAPPMSPNKKNNGARKSVKLANLPKLPNSLSLSKTRSKSKSN
jgi:serine/threonine protein kinase